ncbi:geranylgeranyl pyrophosphate synthetase [Rhypophila decipiens]
MSQYWTHKSRTYRQTGGYKRVFRKSEDDVPATPSPPFGKLIQKIQTSDLDQDAKDFADCSKVGHVKLISSYNWLDNGGPNSSILIPGKPPRWTPHTSPPVLSEDDGKYFRDKNAARFPKHPMEPAVVACIEADPKIPETTDIAACGSTIGNLLRFVRGQDKTFRMLVEKVNKTVFLTRRENSPRELIPDVRGYGHSFPEAYTTWDDDVTGSASHQRIIGYKFGGLDLLVRFEADGYLAPDSKSSPHSSAKSGKREERSVEGLIDDLINTVSESNITVPLPKSISAVEVKRGTLSVDQKDIFDLKTRGIRSKGIKDHLAEELPRLWVSRIPNFILAFHTKGEFKSADIQIKDVRQDVDKWEKDHAINLERLAALLHHIIDIVSSIPAGKMEISHQYTGTLEIREHLPDAGDVLSAEVRKRWESRSKFHKGLMEGEDITDENVKNSVKESTIDDEDAKINSDDDDTDDGGIGWDQKADDDFTACSDRCGYCGKCSYWAV